MDPAEATDWQSVALLPEHVQRTVLETGGPAERVWATWALALRLGTRSVAALRGTLESEPTPGIRCQLVVVLAGLGERSLIRALATSDPDPAVRATACQYVVRTSPAQGSDCAAFVQERLRVDGPRVRQAILDEIESGRLALPDDALADLIIDPDLETRNHALAVVRSLPSLPKLLLAMVLQRTLDEVDEELRCACIDLCIRERLHAELLKRVPLASPNAAHAILVALEMCGYRISADDLLLFADHPAPWVLLALANLLAPPSMMVPSVGFHSRWRVGCA